MGVTRAATARPSMTLAPSAEDNRALAIDQHPVLKVELDRAREHRFRGSGDVLEEDMAAAGERGENEPDLEGLAVDDGLDVVDKTGRDVDGALMERTRELFPGL